MSKEFSKTLCIGENAKGSRVTLELTFKYETRHSLTTLLEPITEYARLSISGHSAGYYGQCEDHIREELDSYKRLFIKREDINEILDIWRTWHLNDMKAGTRAQQAAIERYKAEYPEWKYEYGTACKVLRGIAGGPWMVEFKYIGLDEDDPNHGKWMPLSVNGVHNDRSVADARAKVFADETGRETHVVPIGSLYEDVDTNPQLQGGYRYGSEHLVEPLPNDIKARIAGLFTNDGPPPVDEQTGGLQGFIYRTKVTLDVRSVNERKDRLMDAMPTDSSHFRCTLKVGKRRMGLYYSMGPAHNAEPTLTEVLDCLATDATGYENARGDFDEWCSEYGYDTDSRKAERTFKAVARQAEQLKRLLGDDQYDDLLFHTERD